MPVGFAPFRNMLILVLTIFTLIVGASGWVNWDLGKQIRNAVIDELKLNDDDVKEAINKNVELEKSNLEREIQLLKERVIELEGNSKKGDE